MGKTQDSDEKNGIWRKRPFQLLWLFLLVMSLQAAFASFQEYEPRAGMIFGAISFTLILGGLILRIASRSELL